MLSEDVDLEDLEAMLYGQVYHRSTETQTGLTITTTVNITTTKGPNESQVPPPPPVNSEGHYRHQQIPQFLKRLIANQLKFYPNLLPKLQNIENWSKTLRLALNLFEQGKLSKQGLIKKIRQEAESLKKREENVQKSTIMRNRVREREKQQADVILVSDSDNDSQEPKQIDKDDEIIYVAPPPVPVISVDSDSEHEIEPSPAEEEISNDFIAGQETQNSQFNFSLHGSDFTGNEFLRPANPSEAYETESSTSTSEFARESSRSFNNSVKTIVFNEVEFPKEDIFGENNLDGFRESAPVTGEKSNTQSVPAPKKKDSSDSSSESDYESVPNQNLPSLSPMVSSEKEKPSAKTKKRNIESDDGPRKKNRRRKKKLNTVAETLTEVSNMVTSTPVKDSTVTEESTKKKTPKKKKIENVTTDEAIVEEPQTEEIAEKSPEPEVVIIEQEVSQIEILDSDSDHSNHVPVVSNDLQLANTSICSTISADRDFSEFDLQNIQNKMSDDPSLWQICAKDRLGSAAPRNGARCRRCRQFGHVSSNCTNKPPLPSCTLCSEIGHQAPRCPNKVCFSCGNPGAFSTVYCYKCVKNRNKICDICGLRGHIGNKCPDTWRRYHLTTKAGPLVIPKEGPFLIPKNKQWCAGCSKQGHLDFECDSYKYIREYPAASPVIFRYSDVYAGLSDEQPEENVLNDNRNFNSWAPTQNVFPNIPNETLMNQIEQIFNAPGNYYQNIPQLMDPNRYGPNPMSVLLGSQTLPLNIPPLMPQQNYYNPGPTDLQVQVSPSDRFVSFKNERNVQSFRFRNGSVNDIVEFLKQELDKLKKMPPDARMWKRKLITVQNLQNNRKDRTEAMQKRINFTYKQINMFLFGFKKLKDGKRHLDYLTNFVYQPGNGLRPNKRKSLCDAYNYIFGNQHGNVNYMTLLNNLIVNSRMRKNLI